MARYDYNAVDDYGRKARGTMSSPDEKSLRDKLAAMGAHPVSFPPGAGGGGGRAGGRMSSPDEKSLRDQLAAMGMHLVSSRQVAEGAGRRPGASPSPPTG